MRVIQTSIEKVLNGWKHDYKYLYLIDTNNNHRHHYESELIYEKGHGWYFYDPRLNEIEYIKSDHPTYGINVKIVSIHALLEIT